MPTLMAQASFYVCVHPPALPPHSRRLLGEALSFPCPDGEAVAHSDRSPGGAEPGPCGPHSSPFCCMQLTLGGSGRGVSPLGPHAPAAPMGEGFIQSLGELEVRAGLQPVLTL